MESAKHVWVLVVECKRPQVVKTPKPSRTIDRKQTVHSGLQCWMIHPYLFPEALSTQEAVFFTPSTSRKKTHLSLNQYSNPHEGRASLVFYMTWLKEYVYISSPFSSVLHTQLQPGQNTNGPLWILSLNTSCADTDKGLKRLLCLLSTVTTPPVWTDCQRICTYTLSNHWAFGIKQSHVELII